MLELKKRAAIALAAVLMLLAASSVQALVAPGAGLVNFMANLATTETDKFHNVKATPDDGYVMTGQKGDFVHVTKLNKYGYLEWTKEFDGVWASNANDLDVDQDGNIFVTGYVKEVPDFIIKSIWVAKIAPWGRIVWEKIVTDDTTQTRGVYIAADNTGGCAVSAQFKSSEDSNEWTVFQLSADGELAWAKRYGSDLFDMWCRITAVKNPSGNHDGYLIYEYNTPMGSSMDANDIVFIRLDTAGTMLWAKNYAGYADASHTNPENDFALQAVQTSDGGFAMFGKSYNFSDPDWEKQRRVGYIFKTDASGTLLWSKSFHHNDGSGNDLSFGSMCEDYAGNLVIAGINYKKNGWVAKFDSTGTLITEKEYTGTSDDTLYGIAATSDFGVVAVGMSSSFGDGGKDAWIIKMDSELNVGEGCPGNDPGSTVTDAEFVQGTANPHEIAIEGFETRDWNTEASDPAFYADYRCIPENDQDQDGILDHQDNAPETYNPDQTDSDNDGIGNIVDCDLNNDGVVNLPDFTTFRSQWNSTTSPESDFNSDGVVSVPDYTIFRSLWNSSYPWM